MGEAAAVGPPPGPLALLTRFPVLQRIPARLIAIGPLPEHAPAWARRPAERPTSTAAHLTARGRVTRRLTAARSQTRAASRTTHRG